MYEGLTREMREGPIRREFAGGHDRVLGKILFKDYEYFGVYHETASKLKPYWVLTHLPTGRRIAENFYSSEDCVEAAWWLMHTGVDWAFTDPDECEGPPDGWVENLRYIDGTGCFAWASRKTWLGKPMSVSGLAQAIIAGQRGGMAAAMNKADELASKAE